MVRDRTAHVGWPQSTRTGEVDVRSERGDAPRAYEAFGRGDIPAVMSVFADDIEWHVAAVLPQATDARGKGEVAGFFGKLVEVWEDFSVETEAFVALGRPRLRHRDRKREARRDRGELRLRPLVDAEGRALHQVRRVRGSLARDPEPVSQPR